MRDMPPRFDGDIYATRSYRYHADMPLSFFCHAYALFRFSLRYALLISRQL